MGWYRSVNSRLDKWGYGDLDRLLYKTMVNTSTARLYVRAVMGDQFPLRFRRMSFAGRGSRRHIVLNREMTDAGRMPLGTVLHECAHARQDLLYPGQATSHGEAFTRSYVKIIKSVC